MSTPSFVRTVDKLSFTFGIAILLFTEFIILCHPQWMGWFYTLLVFPMLILRYMSYHQQKIHYFMLDYCYFVQILLLLWLHFFKEDHPRLFMVLFGSATGPLAVAVVAWRNSLVLHGWSEEGGAHASVEFSLISRCFPLSLPNQTLIR
jgi:hypothetical protein